jgi:hypothetical protein
MYNNLPAPNLINNLIKSFFVFTLTPLLLLLLRSFNRLKIGVSPIHDEDKEDDEVDVKKNYINKNVAQTIK